MIDALNNYTPPNQQLPPPPENLYLPYTLGSGPIGDHSACVFTCMCVFTSVCVRVQILLKQLVIYPIL